MDNSYRYVIVLWSSVAPMCSSMAKILHYPASLSVRWKVSLHVTLLHKYTVCQEDPYPTFGRGGVVANKCINL